MTNTYMLPGKYDPEEILASVDKGIYAPNFGGGQVDITTGKFVFSASEAYLIENGKKTAPVKGVMLIGNGPEVLTRVSMVGNDLALDAGLGTCGKDGQSRARRRRPADDPHRLAHGRRHADIIVSRACLRSDRCATSSRQPQRSRALQSSGPCRARRDARLVAVRQTACGAREIRRSVTSKRCALS